MALSESILKDLIVSEAQSRGFVVTGDHAWFPQLAEAIAAAVVKHVQAQAEVPVTGGSSAGSYKVT